jgi:hypothetical protein
MLGSVARKMATLLFDTLRFTVIRRKDGSIEITPKDDPTKARIVHTLESDLLDACHREGFAGVDRMCDQLLTRSNGDKGYQST